MKNEITIYCPSEHLSEVTVEGGSTLFDVWSVLHPDASETQIPVCALVNNKVEAMSYPLYSPKTVEFLPHTHPASERTCIRSLCMMLYHAVEACCQHAQLHVEHSLAHGYYCRITGQGQPVDQQLVDALACHMRRLVDLDLPFVRHEQRSGQVAELFSRQGLNDKVMLMQTLHQPYTVYYTLDHLADSYYGPLAPRTSSVPVFELHHYKDGLLLMGPDALHAGTPAKPVAQDKMYGAFTDHLRFNSIVGVDCAGELNEAVTQGHSAQLINVAEAMHNNRIASIADDIARRYNDGGARMVLIAGPSSSGKTTFTKRLAIQLITNLLRPTMISLDDYFVNREQTPLDAGGEYDYESLYALDLATFNDHLRRLIAGQTVELPTYNFSTGRREWRGNKISLTPGSILLVEGIHGLNPQLTPAIADAMKYRVYVSALTTISLDAHNWIPTTDNRLLRRMVRDAKYRGVSPVDTMRRWPSVRRGEEQWIFPYQENADAMFNSSLFYELAVLKPRAEQLLRRVPHDVAEYADANRLRTYLGCFEPISEQYVPSTSLLREFIGGSSFKY